MPNPLTGEGGGSRTSPEVIIYTSSQTRRVTTLRSLIPDRMYLWSGDFWSNCVRSKPPEESVKGEPRTPVLGWDDTERRYVEKR